jgi:hypothetical protein
VSVARGLGFVCDMRTAINVFRSAAGSSWSTGTCSALFVRVAAQPTLEPAENAAAEGVVADVVSRGNQSAHHFAVHGIDTAARSP